MPQAARSVRSGIGIGIGIGIGGVRSKSFLDTSDSAL
jgi:hypothetical protein